MRRLPPFIKARQFVEAFLVVGTCAKKDHTMRRADEIMGRPWRGVIIVSLNTSLKGLPGAPPDDADEMRSVDPRR